MARAFGELRGQLVSYQPGLVPPSNLGHSRWPDPLGEPNAGINLISLAIKVLFAAHAVTFLPRRLPAWTSVALRHWRASLAPPLHQRHRAPDVPCPSDRRNTYSSVANLRLSRDASSTNSKTFHMTFASPPKLLTLLILLAAAAPPASAQAPPRRVAAAPHNGQRLAAKARPVVEGVDPVPAASSLVPPTYTTEPRAAEESRVVEKRRPDEDPHELSRNGINEESSDSDKSRQMTLIMQLHDLEEQMKAESYTRPLLSSTCATPVTEIQLKPTSVSLNKSSRQA